MTKAIETVPGSWVITSSSNWTSNNQDGYVFVPVDFKNGTDIAGEDVAVDLTVTRLTNVITAQHVSIHLETGDPLKINMNVGGDCVDT